MSIVLPSLIGANKPASGGAFTNLRSISLDGTDDSLDVASTSDYAFGTSGFSIGFWFNPVGTNNSSGFGVNIFDMRSVTVNQAKPSLWMSSTGSGSILKYYAAGAYRTTWSGTLNPGSWYHLLITNDGSNTKFYLNGNSTAIATGSDSTNYIAAGLRIGGYSGNNYYYNGLIDEFAIWNATLSGADANAICSGSDFVPNDLSEASSYETDRTSNLIGWWRMGDGTEAGSGTTVYDMSTNSNNGTLTNIASPNGFVRNVPYNYFSLSLDGTNDYMDCGGASDFSFNNGSGTDSAFSISAWVKFDNTDRARAVSKDNGLGSREYLFGTNNSHKVNMILGDGSNNLDIRNNATINTSDWFHIVATYDGSKSISGLKVYVNADASSLTDVSAGTYAGMPQSTGNLEIGRFANAHSFFNGLVDEVAVFSKELTASDVTNIYNTGFPNDIGTNGLNLDPLAWWRMGDNDGGTGTTVTDQGSGGNNGTLTNGPTYSTSVPS